MKVKDMIKKLSKLDPEMDIMIYERGMEWSGYRQPYIGEDKVVTKTINTYDAFDYERYSTEVIVSAYREDLKNAKSIITIF